jgi:hypothetical protein
VTVATPRSSRVHRTGLAVIGDPPVGLFAAHYDRDGAS